MGVAAYKKQIWIAEDDGGSPDSATWVQVPAASANLDQDGTVLDDTYLGIPGGQRSRIIGLIEWGVTMTVNYEVSGPLSLATGMLHDAWKDRDLLHVQYLPDGVEANGYQGRVSVQNFNMSGGFDDLETADVNLLSKGEIGACDEKPATEEETEEE